MNIFFHSSANVFRPLRQTVSWDTPNGLTNTQQRAMSVDTNSTNSNETNRCSNISDESGPTPAAPISSSSSEQDNHEAGAWSSDYSNSEDEYPNAEDTAPVSSTLSTLQIKTNHFSSYVSPFANINKPDYILC